MTKSLQESTRFIPSAPRSQFGPNALRSPRSFDECRTAPSSYRPHWRIQDFRLGGQVERQRREYRGAADAEGVGSPEMFFLFLPRNSAFCVHSQRRMIRQFTTPVLIRLKPAKSSDIVIKPCKVIIRLCFSGIGLSVCK